MVGLMGFSICGQCSPRTAAVRGMLLRVRQRTREGRMGRKPPWSRELARAMVSLPVRGNGHVPEMRFLRSQNGKDGQCNAERQERFLGVSCPPAAALALSPASRGFLFAGVKACPRCGRVSATFYGATDTRRLPHKKNQCATSGERVMTRATKSA